MKNLLRNAKKLSIYEFLVLLSFNQADTMICLLL